MSIDYPGSFRRGPAYTGQLIIRSWRGKLIAQKWPRKRGKPKSEKQRRANQAFANATYNAQRSDYQQWLTAEWITKGTPLYPRDVLTAAQYGREIGPVETPDGLWWPVSIIQDVSNSLDAISQVPASTMVRGRHVWQAVDPGPAGYVFTSQGVDAAPEWLPPSGGGGTDAGTPPLTDFGFVASSDLQRQVGNSNPIGFLYEPSGSGFRQSLMTIDRPSGIFRFRAAFETHAYNASAGGAGIGLYRSSDQRFITVRQRQGSLFQAPQISIDRYSSPGNFESNFYREQFPNIGPLEFVIRFDGTNLFFGVGAGTTLTKVLLDGAESALLNGFDKIALVFIANNTGDGGIIGNVTRWEVE